MRLRIVCTNDFLGSVAPMRTSYGTLPGAHALRQTVARLREGQPAVWADAGDFSQGGPLSTTTGGALSFNAAGELGIEVATVGNHELDWGLEHLAEHRKALPFPLVCANLDLGVEPTALLQTAAGPVGFIGLTHPQLDAFTPYAKAPRGDLEQIVPKHAASLRDEGAVAVVVLIHFGVSWSVGSDGAHEPDPTPVLDLCRPFHHAVDAIVLGHTLGRWADVVEGVPYAQPWAFGAELGVIDLDLENGAHGVRLVTVEGERGRWEGAGHAQIDMARRTVIGRLEAPLRIDFAKDISLADFAARALREAAGTTGAVVPVVGMHQPAIEGVMYDWPKGEVTEADLSRFWPWSDDRSLTAEVSGEELAKITSFTAPEPWLAWGTSAAPASGTQTPPSDASAPPRDTKATIAVPRDYVDWGTVQIAELLGREPAWRTVEVRLHDAIRTALAD